MSGDPERPDPEAIYECVAGFVSGRVPGVLEFTAREGWRAPGSHPAVVEHFKDGYFRLAPDDVIRRQQAEILARLQSPAPTAKRSSKAKRRPPGRPEGSGLRIKDRTQLLTAYRQFRERNNGRRPYQPELARELDVGTRTLQQALTRLTLPWPPE